MGIPFAATCEIYAVSELKLCKILVVARGGELGSFLGGSILGTVGAK